MTINEFREAGSEITYRDWTILIGIDFGGAYLQVQFRCPSSRDQTPEIQHGRKWRLSYHMTRSEFIRTAFAACLAAEEHEAREHFFYRGAAVFGPHIDVDVLRRIAACHDRRGELHEVAS